MIRSCCVTLLALTLGATAAPETAESQILKKAKNAIEKAAKEVMAENSATAQNGQEPTAVSLPAVDAGRFIATASRWWKDDGSGEVERVEWTGRAVVIVSKSPTRPTREIQLHRCEDAKDTPRFFRFTMRSAADTAGLYNSPGIEYSTNQMSNAPLNTGRFWVRLESVTEGRDVGTAWIRWDQLQGAKPVILQFRFQAQRRDASDRTPICPPSAPALQKAAAPATTPAATSNNTFQGTDGFKPTPYTPAYPFGLENLETTIANDPPAVQQEVRAALRYLQSDYYDSQYYDAGCFAHAFREYRKTPGASPVLLTKITATPKNGCVDRAKIVKIYVDLVNRGGVSSVGNRSLQTSWNAASPEQRARFANCYGERMGEFMFVALKDQTGLNNKTPPAAQYAEACKGALQ